MVQSRNRPDRNRSSRQSRPGFQPKRSTAARFVRRRLRCLSPDARQILEVFRLAVEGDRSGLDRLTAEALAAAELLRRRLVDEVFKEGVVVKQGRRGRSRRPVWTGIRAHPALTVIRALDKLLGFTAKDLGLTRRSRGKDERRDLLAARQRHDAMLRAADMSGLPAPDPELFRKKPS